MEMMVLVLVQSTEKLRSDAVTEEAHATSVPPHAPPQTLWLLDNFNIKDSYD